VGYVDVDVVNGTVVIEVVAFPITTVITDAGITEAVVDAAIEADVKTPEAAMETIAAAVEAPITRGPESPIVRRSTPGAGDPIVAGGSPAPVTGGPEVVGRGGYRLIVDRKRWRGFVGIFDGLALTFGVELVVGLSVLVSLILIGWRGQSSLLWGSCILFGLFGALLGLSLRADAKDLSLSRSRLLWLAIVDWRHVGVGRVGPRVVRCGCDVGVFSMAACCPNDY
jgi:hypothetical protein